MSRPQHLVVVAGTGTDIGKTWVTCRLAELARAGGRSVAVRKPAQSFVAGEQPTEAERLALSSGEEPYEVCRPSRWYPVPMAPPMAAEAAGMPPVLVEGLLADIVWPDPGPHLGLVEQAGGIGAPQALDADGVEMARRLGPDCVVLVVRPGLGTLSDTRLAVMAVRAVMPAQCELLVYMNRFEARDTLHRANLQWLREREDLEVLTGPEDLLERLCCAHGARAGGVPPCPPGSQAPAG